MQLSIHRRLLLFALVIILFGASLTAVTTIYFQLKALEWSHQHFGKEFAEITGKHAIPALKSGNIEQLNHLIEPIAHEDDFVYRVKIQLAARWPCIDGICSRRNSHTVSKFRPFYP